MKLPSATLSHMRELASQCIGGKHMRIEVGIKRFLEGKRKDEEFTNLLECPDENNFDLSETMQWKCVKVWDFNFLQGDLLLDLYIYHDNGMDNMLVLIRIDGTIIKAGRDLHNPFYDITKQPA